jgi:hypothetical protein
MQFRKGINYNNRDNEQIRKREPAARTIAEEGNRIDNDLLRGCIVELLQQSKGIGPDTQSASESLSHL